jgi:hypothetical protein
MPTSLVTLGRAGVRLCRIAAGQLECDPDIATLAITVGLFDEYGPAQRLYE